MAPLRVLVVEDSEDDTKLLVRLLTKEGFEVAWERVCTAEAMRAALQGAAWDLILADHTMPEFSALGALDTLKRSGLDLPFIIVSGLIGEDVAIEAMKAGAHDYITKGRTARLVPAIKRELREATVRRERRQAAEALERINAELEQRVAERTAQLEAANVELRHAIAERQQREREFTTLVEHSTDMITRVDSNLRHIYVNPEALRLMGLRFEQVIGKTGVEIGLPPAIESIGSAAVRRAIETGKVQVSELSVRTADGLRFYEGHHIPEFDETGKVTSVLGIARDITERKRAEEALRESEERYRHLVELSPEAVLVHGEDHIVFINTAGAKLFGAERPEEIIGRPLLDFVAPGYLGTVKRRIRQMQDEGRQAPLNEEELLRVDGTPFIAEVAGVPITYAGKPAAQLVARDITERRKAEQFREEYLSLISHDLRTPLTTLMGTADWLRRGLERQGTSREAESAANILKSARRMAAMITDLVDCVRLESGHLQLRREPTDLVQLASDIAQRTGTLEDRQRIHIEVPTPVPAVSVDRDRVERAITNLITNALKYSSPDVPVVIRVEQQNGSALVSLIDQGVGIPSEDLPRLFERHFRAKTAGRREGLGPGLYITRLIAEAHGGQVSVASEVGKGSTFRLSLPLA